ncbi:MAG: hypothetical protein V4593_08105 [Pseudomonadota bacterium]
MYDYTLTDDNAPPSYRPDLKTVIEHWIASVPESDWAYFVGFRVGCRGQFVAKFMKAPTRGGPLRLVTFTVDHNHSSMATSDHLWHEPATVKYTSANLTMAVDTVA